MNPNEEAKPVPAAPSEEAMEKADMAPERLAASAYCADGELCRPEDGQAYLDWCDCQNEKEFVRCATRFRITAERRATADLRARLEAAERERDSLRQENAELRKQLTKGKP